MPSVPWTRLTRRPGRNLPVSRSAIKLRTAFLKRSLSAGSRSAQSFSNRAVFSNVAMASVVQAAQEIVGTLVHRSAAGRDVRGRLVLSPLPGVGPEPTVLGG